MCTGIFEDRNTHVRERFNLQAQRFDDWSITGEEDLLSSFYNFAGIDTNDRLLDVACGTGRFAVYAAKRIQTVCGVDLSPNMLNLAREHAAEQGLTNVRFYVREGEYLPFPDEDFTVVTSKAAFHHMENYKQVFSEMTRCCRQGGSVSLQDIVAYEIPEVDQYFEDFEIAIDSSHCRSLRKRELFELFKNGPFEISRLFETQSLLDVNDYVKHATQNESERSRLSRLIEHGLRDPVTKPFFVSREDRLYFRRRVFVISGTRIKL